MKSPKTRKRLSPKPGEIWFVKLQPDSSALAECHIIELTPKTVYLQDIGGFVCLPTRHERKTVKFVERRFKPQPASAARAIGRSKK